MRLTTPHREAARLLNTAAAILAGSVAMDGTSEHYRAKFHHPLMFVAPAVSLAALVTALAALPRRYRQDPLTQVVFGGSILTGLIGFGFHIRNVSRRVGGWNSANVFHGAPVAAPMALTMAGTLGLAASVIDRRDALGTRLASPLAMLSVLGLIGTSAEASALHFRGAFQNPFMYAPVAVPPIAAAMLATTSVTQSVKARRVADMLLRSTAWLGIIGMGFHAWGVHRRMGGWRNWRQNLLVGPPLPAPPAFTGLALAGLASLELLNIDRVR